MSASLAVFRVEPGPAGDFISYGPAPDFRPEVRFHEKKSGLFAVYVLNEPPRHDGAWRAVLKTELDALAFHAEQSLRSMGDERKAVFRLC